MFTPEARRRTAKNVSDILESDDRIEAVLIVGSLASTTADRWSDIDLVAVISNEADHEAVSRDWVRRIYDQLPVLHHFVTAFGETAVRGFLLENMLELDLAFTPRSQLAVWAPASSRLIAPEAPLPPHRVQPHGLARRPGGPPKPASFGMTSSMPARR